MQMKASMETLRVALSDDNNNTPDNISPWEMYRSGVDARRISLRSASALLNSSLT